MPARWFRKDGWHDPLTRRRRGPAQLARRWRRKTRADGSGRRRAGADRANAAASADHVVARPTRRRQSPVLASAACLCGRRHPRGRDRHWSRHSNRGVWLAPTPVPVPSAFEDAEPEAAMETFTAPDGSLEIRLPETWNVGDGPDSSVLYLVGGAIELSIRAGDADGTVLMCDTGAGPWETLRYLRQPNRHARLACGRYRSDVCGRGRHRATGPRGSERRSTANPQGWRRSRRTNILPGR